MILYWVQKTLLLKRPVPVWSMQNKSQTRLPNSISNCSVHSMLFIWLHTEPTLRANTNPKRGQSWKTQRSFLFLFRLVKCVQLKKKRCLKRWEKKKRTNYSYLRPYLKRSICSRRDCVDTQLSRTGMMQNLSLSNRWFAIRTLLFLQSHTLVHAKASEKCILCQERNLCSAMKDSNLQKSSQVRFCINCFRWNPAEKGLVTLDEV